MRIRNFQNWWKQAEQKRGARNKWQPFKANKETPERVRKGGSFKNEHVRVAEKHKIVFKV